MASKQRPKRARRGGAPTIPGEPAVSVGRALAQRLGREGVAQAKIGGFDLDGVLRGKYVSLEKLASAVDHGFGFCDVVFGWDMVDGVYDSTVTTGARPGYPDTEARLDPSTLRAIPWEPGTAAMLCDFRGPGGAPHPACSRSLLRGVIDRLGAAGFTANVGCEFEFYVFQETRDSLVDKGFRGLQPLDPGMFGYSWVRSGQDADLMRDILQGMRDFDVSLEGLHPETGPGVYEAAIRYADPLRAADQAALFKVAMKQIAHRHGLAVTFMAKWNASLPGSSGHLHQSLWRDGKNAFHDARAPRGMSRVFRSFLAGQLALQREFTALYSPTINSYKRYVPGVWAPLVPCWGVENRTAALRVIGLGDPGAIRVEFRQTAADMNPHVAIAASLAAGLHGVETGLELPPETRGDPGEGGDRGIPRSLQAATDLLDSSQAARALLGAAFVDHYVATRRWEVRTYERAVTDFELARYFEVV